MCDPFVNVIRFHGLNMTSSFRKLTENTVFVQYIIGVNF